MLPVNTAQQH